MHIDISIPRVLVHDMENQVLNAIVRVDKELSKIIISTSQYSYDKIRLEYFKYRGKDVRRYSASPDIKNILFGTYGRLNRRLKYLDADLYCVERSNKNYISITNPSNNALMILSEKPLFNVEMACYSYSIVCTNRISSRYIYSCIRNNGYFRKANGRILVKDYQNDSFLNNDSESFCFEIFDDMCEINHPIVRVEEVHDAAKGKHRSYVVKITLWAYADRRGRNVRVSKYLNFREKHSELSRYLVLKRCYWARKVSKKQLHEEIPLTSLNLMKKYSESGSGLKLANAGKTYEFLKRALEI